MVLFCEGRIVTIFPMPSRRRNWQQADSTEWVKILRGRRPPSVQWPSAKSQDTKKTNPVAQPVQKTLVRRVAKEYSPGPLPEDVMSAAQASVVRLEKALGALDDADVAAEQALQSALERARARASERSLKDRIKDAELFLERAGKRLANANSNILQAEEALTEARMQRVRRQEELEGGQARLETLRTESTSSFGLQSHPMS